MEETTKQPDFPPMDAAVTNKEKRMVQVVKCTDRISSPQQDSCWSWVVCFAGVVSNIIVCGFAFSYGILFPSILDEFQEGKATTAWIGSLAMMGAGLYGPLVGKLYHRFGARVISFTGALICVASLIATSKAPNIYVMFLTYGGLFGIGSGFVYMSVYLIVPKYFVKRRSLSLGLVAMGPGGGLFIMSPIVQELLERFEWRGTFLSMAGVVSVICLLSCTFRPFLLEIDHVDYNQERSEHFWDVSILKNKPFVIYTVAAVVFYLGHHIPSVHMVRYWEELGFPEKQASRLYIYSGIVSLLIRPVIGQLCDTNWFNPCYIYIGAASLEGLVTFLLPLATKNFHFVLFFVMYGLTDGTMGCGLCIAVMTSLPGKQRVFGFSVYQTISSIAAACGPALGGFVADLEGSYVPVFYMVGALGIAGAITMLPLTCIKKPVKLNETDSGKVLESLIVVEKCSVV